MKDLYLGLGSNLGNREELLRQAVDLLTKRIGELKSLSAFYETEPWGFASAHPFLNAVLVLQTNKGIEEIFKTTREVERELGRKKKTVKGGYSDRSIDIDILLWGDTILEVDFHWPEEECVHLSIPHPVMHQRRFVMQPLVEVTPEGVHPVLKRTFKELLCESE